MTHRNHQVVQLVAPMSDPNHQVVQFMAKTIQTEEDVFQEICKMLEPFNNTEKQIDKETDILRDLDIDSLAVMNFIMKLEDEFDISIPLNMLPDMRTVRDLVVMVDRAKEEA